MAAHSCGAWEKSIFIALGLVILVKTCILPAHVVHLDGVDHLASNGYRCITIIAGHHEKTLPYPRVPGYPTRRSVKKYDPSSRENVQ